MHHRSTQSKKGAAQRCGPVSLMNKRLTLKVVATAQSDGATRLNGAEVAVRKQRHIIGVGIGFLVAQVACNHGYVPLSTNRSKHHAGIELGV